MPIRGGRGFAMAVVLLLTVGACTESKSEDVSSPYSANDVILPEPTLKVVPTGAWLLSASFAWRICGERACWAYDERQHGGPDVFGVYVDRLALTVESTKLTLESSCGESKTLGEAVTGEAGAFFLVQERTEKDGCQRRGSDRVFNMASGELEAIVRPVAGAPCEGLLSVTALFAHSWRDTGRNVKVNAGRSPPQGLRIDWGDDAVHQFQSVGSRSGIYDCTGAPK